MAKYFLKKGIQLIIVTILISFFSFAVIYAAPGDISGMYLNEQMSDEEKEAIRENLGLNKSMPEQYWGWAKEVLKGDFGISQAASGNPAADGSRIGSFCASGNPTRTLVGIPQEYLD